jgi:hypothetical protein
MSAAEVQTLKHLLALSEERLRGKEELLRVKEEQLAEPRLYRRFVMNRAMFYFLMQVIFFKAHLISICIKESLK